MEFFGEVGPLGRGQRNNRLNFGDPGFPYAYQDTHLGIFKGFFDKMFGGVGVA